MIRNSNQHGINIRARQHLAKIVVGLDAIVGGLMEPLGIDLIAVLLRIFTALPDHVTSRQNLHVLASHVASGHIGPGTAQQMAGTLATQADEAHGNSFARRG